MPRDQKFCAAYPLNAEDPCQSPGGGGWLGFSNPDQTPFVVGNRTLHASSDGEFVFYFLIDPNERPTLCRTSCPDCCVNASTPAAAAAALQFLKENEFISSRSA
jgi:hypothetical protein